MYLLGPLSVKYLLGPLLEFLDTTPMAAPKQTDPQFKLRMPQSLKDSLDQAVMASGRTLNAEILWRLQQTFEIEERNEVARQHWRNAKDTTGSPPSDNPVMEELSRVLAEEQTKTLFAVMTRFGIPMGGDVPLPTPRRSDKEKK